MQKTAKIELTGGIKNFAWLGWSQMHKNTTSGMKKEVNANQAEVHLALGEVAMDSSTDSQANKEFQACITPRKYVNQTNIRSLAKFAD